MKNGTAYAGRLKKAYAKLRQSVDAPRVPEQPDEPLRRLAIGIFGASVGDERAEAAVNRALSTMVDWNEIRVSVAHELEAAIGNLLGGDGKACQRLIEALRSVYRQENRLSLDRLKSFGRREARQYLEKIDGVDDYATASVLLWSLGGHAIPVSDPLLAALREADLVHPMANRSEVQAFLERHVNANDAKEFCLVMRHFVPTKRTASKPAKAKKERT